VCLLPPGGWKRPLGGSILAVVAGEIVVPNVIDREAAASVVIREVLGRWKGIKPEEYAAWPRYCREYRKSLLDGGWSQTREMKVPFLIPQYVQLMVGRIVGDPSWNFREEALVNAFLREVPCSRMDPDIGTARSSALCRADKDRTWTD